MCGITGFWQPAPAMSNENVRHLLQTMNDTLRHRGPDGDGMWICAQNGIALGHRRLSIRDLSATGAQPMLSSNERFVIVFNGEIYNAEELRGEIDKLGAGGQWRGTSDTEVMLEVIATLGLDEALRRSVGMFAFALWDKAKQELSIARDRFGEKPLFYAITPQAVIFGSELKALRCHPATLREVDTESLQLYLRYGYVPAPHSIFRGVAKLLPGDLRIFRRENGCFLENSRPFWRHETDLYGQKCCRTKYASVSAAADALLPVLEDAVKHQLIADVPLGAFLSGGIDSSLIVALMQRISAGQAKTFTIGFDDSRYDEAPFARAMARHLGTDHFEEYVGQREIFDVLPRLPEIYDEPIGDSSQIPTILVAQAARRHVTVCLSGDGGDELFGGYNHYRWGPAVLRAAACVPALLAPSVGALIVRGGYQLSKQRLVRLGEVLRARPKVETMKLLNAAIPDVRRIIARMSGTVEKWSLPRSLDGLRDAERLMAFDLHGYLPDDILVKVDRAAMSVSLETRAPFLNHAVASFAWSLPLALRTSSASGKLVLRELLARFVPRNLFERPKRGFGLPLHRWLREELKPVAEKYLIQIAPRYDCWLNPAEVTRLWDEHQSGKFNRQRELWALMMLLMWLETN